MAKDRLWVESGGRASQTIYCASVSPIVGSVSATARRKPVSVSDNVRWKPTFIACRAVHHCAPLHLPADETGCQGVQDRPGVAVHLGRDQRLGLLHSGNNLFGDVVDPLFRPRESRKTIRWVQTEQRTAGYAMRSAGMESTRCHHRRGNAVTLDLPICRARRFSVGFSIGRHRRRGWVRAPSPCALSHPARPAPAMHRRSRVHGLAESVWVHQHACVEGAIPIRSYVPLTGPSIVASRPSSARTWANFCGSM